jgi:hypothetical protein
MAQPFEHAGKKYTNADAWRTAKATSSAKPMAKSMGNPTGELPAEDEQDPHAVVAEHGKASEVHIEHDHEMGAHHVHSIHEDGHEHHSDHASAEEAHEHAKNLALDDAEHEEPEGEEEDGWDKE